MSEKTPARGRLLEHTTDIISAYAGNNALPNQELPALIAAVYNTVAGLGSAATVEKREPAVPIKDSVSKRSILCLECGQSNKMLKRHLANAHGLTPEEYRQKWGLPPTYPMVSPEYSLIRKKLAVELGLGRKSKTGRKAHGN